MNRLKARREELNLTQKQVADRIGIKPQQYQLYEYKKMLPNVELGIAIARALETTAEALYGD